MNGQLLKVALQPSTQEFLEETPSYYSKETPTDYAGVSYLSLSTDWNIV